MSEGSLQAPVRHPLDWQNPDFYDEASLDAELRRVFDICHGCRRCFNLCDSFPRLFELVDGAASGEVTYSVPPGWTELAASGMRRAGGYGSTARKQFARNSFRRWRTAPASRRLGCPT